MVIKGDTRSLDYGSCVLKNVRLRVCSVRGLRVGVFSRGLDDSFAAGML